MPVHSPQFMSHATRLRLLTVPAALLGASFLVLSGCGSTNDTAKLTRELLTMPKEEAYARGEALVKKKKYESGRQYLRFVAENYANDPIGRQASLRLADSFFDEKTQLGYLEAGVRYKDFRNRYPSHPKSDYALFRLAQCSDRQAERPDREQTNTRVAATAYRELIINYPDSPYATEARARLGVMRNLLAEHEYRVGHFYLKRKAWRAARGRMEFILTAYPEYAGLDKVLYEAGLLEGRMGNMDERQSLWQRLQKDYPASPLVRRLPAPPASPAVPVRTAGG
ncbi:MAG: outer membrane protein assembly factor BamD [Acidobacteriota bacterium]|nr:outer membrane protein assembly factor BamD [Acidobacteriota bacterium]